MKAFCIGFCSVYWLEVWKMLAARHGIRPELAIQPAIESMGVKAALEAEFPGVLCLEWHDVMRNKFTKACGFDLKHMPFDEYCERVWTEDAQIVLDQYQRFDLSLDFGFVERTQHFYQQLVFWNALLDLRQPDVVIFRSAPHSAFDLILLCLVKKRGLRHVVLHYGREAQHFVSGDLDAANAYGELARWAEWEATAEKGSPTSPQEKANDLFHAHRSDQYESAAPSAVLSFHENTKKQKFDGPFAPEYAMAYARQLITALRQDFTAWFKKADVPDGYPLLGVFKERGRPLALSFRGFFTRTRHLIARVRAHQATASLHAAMLEATPPRDIFSSSSPPPFIYVSLHYQPEESSNPRGGIYTQQLLMLNVLAHSIPEGWELWVKDHPAQLHASLGKIGLPDLVTGHLMRNDDFYRLAAAIPAVRLLPPDSIPFKMIDASRAVATITGTVGWESLLRGKPVIAFGRPWYGAMKGVFMTSNVTECRRAISKLGDTTVADDDVMRRFAKGMDHFCLDLACEWAAIDEPERVKIERIAEVARAIASSAGVDDASITGARWLTAMDKPQIPKSAAA